MTENEFLLEDRIAKIRSVVEKYGEENFYVSFSGGKDSTVLSALIDIALPGNTIPRVFANTGIEYRLIVEFVEREREHQHPWELIILQPKVPIKQMLEKEGYPFKSKQHARYVKAYQNMGMKPLSAKKYLGIVPGNVTIKCPKILRYQFTEEGAPFKISQYCCVRLKEDPMKNYSKESKRPYAITGIMPSEGGQRMTAKCLSFRGGELSFFQPLVPLSEEWEDWFIKEYRVNICELYNEPYNFERTGCKGCPFNPHLQKELDVLEQFFPAERKQCELIWKTVYDEYRRLGYRLKPLSNEYQVTISGQLRFDENMNITEET